MKQKARTLVLEATGFSRNTVLRDSILHGIFGMYEPEHVLPKWFLQKYPEHRLTRFIQRLFTREYDSLSYVVDWRESLQRSPILDCEICNVHNKPQFSSALRKIRDYDFIVILHSATGDSMDALLRVADRFRSRRCKLAVFIGNEYNLMESKQAFLCVSGADFVLSQLPLDTARWLYDQAVRGQGTIPLSVPHGLNPALYIPGPRQGRSIDVGFIGAFYHLVIGDKERTNAIEWFEFNGSRNGLRCDIRQGNIPRGQWRDFLRSCRTIVGAESNTYYLQRDGAAVQKAIAYLETHPAPSFKEVFDHAFADARDYIDGKVISSRHFEPIGTKTTQVLVEGRYNDILRPNDHYIPVAKDLSNIQEVVDKIKDEGLVHEIAERSYQYVMDNHTYDHRIKYMLDIVLNN